MVIGLLGSGRPCFGGKNCVPFSEGLKRGYLISKHICSLSKNNNSIAEVSNLILAWKDNYIHGNNQLGDLSKYLYIQKS
jgi:hypothetical protein